ncbi:cytochrome c oxidase subunit II [Litoribrevibacter euphylliae]|uniref:Cytochrome c oxidase subunit 2 n=1 Tax=Litoribrevibacter euphylliae TaxID=1834034 RepID=A0ABV7HAL0_9GAMM
MLSAFARLRDYFAYCLGILVLSPSVQAAWEVNMPKGITPVSETVYDLHMIIFYICVVIAIIVFGVMFWSIIHHRKSKGYKPANFHESTLVEIVWTAIPLLILIIMAIPATQGVFAMYNTEDSDIDIQVTGYQWKWRYQYLGEDIDFFSTLSTPRDQIDNMAAKGENYLLEVDAPLVVPVEKKIRFLLTSNDVIHAWWVPELAVKKDAIPGFINETWTYIKEPGIYRGQCAELCGKDHGFMPIVVKAVEQQEYQDWISEKKEQRRLELAKAAAEAELIWDLNELMTKGQEVYEKNCLACHQATGEGLPPVFPALKGSPIIKGDIAEHIRIVLHGQTGTAMAAYAAQLSDSDIASVVTYERNAWGQNSGDTVQPSDVAELR